MQCSKFKLKFVAFKDSGRCFFYGGRAGVGGRGGMSLFQFYGRPDYRAGTSACWGRTLTTPPLSNTSFPKRDLVSGVFFSLPFPQPLEVDGRGGGGKEHQSRLDEQR